MLLCTRTFQKRQGAECGSVGAPGWGWGWEIEGDGREAQGSLLRGCTCSAVDRARVDLFRNTLKAVQLHTLNGRIV